MSPAIALTILSGGFIAGTADLYEYSIEDLIRLA